MVALVAGLSGAFAMTASSASAIPFGANVGVNGDTDDIERVCTRANVRLFGNPIGTGEEKICVP